MMFVYTIGDIAGIAFLLLMLVIAAFGAIERYARQAFCKHEKYFETMACDAVCRKCNKNLGFIGRVQEERAALKETGNVG